MKIWPFVLLLLVACGDDTIYKPCDEAAMPEPPYLYATREIDGNTLRWMWKFCPPTIDCGWCYEMTETWEYNGCTWEYVGLESERVRCYEPPEDDD